MQYPPGCLTLTEMWHRCRAHLAPAGAQAYFVIIYIGEKGKPWTDWDFAAKEFIRLITSADWDKFRGPCPRCGKYFVRATSKEKRYCSRECASISAAMEATRNKRYREHEDKLKRAQDALRRFKPGRSRRGWKEWVSANEPDISKKWLTRAVTNRELQLPPDRT
jgi:endogenous inhibitor of DNA gyrase (YacG/DUF329 family)